MAGETDQVKVYQIRVYLRQISPMIWRRLLVRSDRGYPDRGEHKKPGCISTCTASASFGCCPILNLIACNHISILLQKTADAMDAERSLSVAADTNGRTQR